jgi:hypothetical protein
MGATPVKGWPYPVGTDKVVDGDNAIKAVADMLDARMGMYVCKPSTVLNGTINPDGSVTANASSGWVELRGVFSAAFRFYRVVYAITGGNAVAAAARLMVGTAQVQDAGAYPTQRWFASGSSLQGAQSTDNLAYIGSVLAAQHQGELLVFNPADATQPTSWVGSDLAASLPGGAGMMRAVNAAEDGIAIQKTAADTKGYIKVFGL